MSGKTAVIIGGTGMIGQYLTEQLVKDPYFETVRLLVRRPLEKPDPAIEIKLVDFADAESIKLALEDSDVIFCAIGTTQKNVKGDKTLYRKIDFDIPVRVARFGKEAGCEKFVVVSSVGADSKSNTFYLQLKGELEEALADSGIETVHIMQPSLLLGQRKEKRNGEGLLQATGKLLSGLLIGSWRKYRAMDGNTLAKAMIAAAKKEEKGVFRFQYDGIKKLVAGS